MPPRLLGDFDRRAVVAVAMVLLAAGNVLTVLAQGFTLLAVSRTVLGIGMGVVWSLAPAIAPRLVSARRAALAVSLTMGGVAAASVIGVPLGTFVGEAFGWRTAFGTLTASALLLAAALLVALPKLPKPAPATTRAGGQPLLRTPAVVVGLIVIVFLVTAHFAAYTFIRPLLETSTGTSAAAVAAVLLTYGVFGLVGNFAAGSLAAKRPAPPSCCSPSAASRPSPPSPCSASWPPSRSRRSSSGASPTAGSRWPGRSG